MRIAILSDIHGNSLALDAVLADAATLGVEAHWILGDLAALGPDPVGVLERLSALQAARIIRGNTDRYVATGGRPAPDLAAVQANPQLVQQYAEVAATLAWTQGALQVSGWMDWLACLPLELDATLPDGTNFLGVHASPGNDDGEGIPPTLADDELARALGGHPADLICVGHTHLQIDRRIGRQRIVNPGSVSNPRGSDLRASYVLLEAGPDGYSLTFRRVDYDRQQIIAALQAMHHPGAEYIIRHMQGLVD
jgi:predicted phosphodiesterase